MYQKCYFHSASKTIYCWDDEKGLVTEKYSAPLGRDMPEYQQYLIDKYGTDDTVSKGHKEFFFDIEIEMGDALTEEYIKRAPKKVTSIAYWDKVGNEWGCYILDENNRIKTHTDKSGRRIISCKDEPELLLRFIEKFKEINPDIIIGYNSDYFDIPYLCYRIRKILGEEEVKDLSPINISYPGTYQFYYKIAGVIPLDYFRLHKKYSWEDEPSWSLDAIGEKYTGIKKIEYEGTLDDLYRDDIDKFIEYNFRDVYILKKLDEKLQYIALTKNLCHKGKCNYDDVYANSKIHDGAISSYLKSQKQLIPWKEKNPIDKADYAGGYLFCPKAGLYNYMFDLDLTSLYPSIIMTLNVGKETFILQVVDPDNDRNNRLGLNDLKKMDPDTPLIVEDPQQQRWTEKAGKLIKFIEKNHLSVSANGCLFRTDKPSTLSRILAKWFEERVIFKNEMKKAYKAKDQEKGDYYYLQQYTMKILLNSLYGATALRSFRYGGDTRLSEAVTLSGQRIIQESAFFVNRDMNREIGNKEMTIQMKDLEDVPEYICNGDEGNYVAYCDTDSVYVHAHPILKERYDDFDSKDEEVKDNLVQEIAEEYEDKVTKFYDLLARTTFNARQWHWFKDQKKDHWLEMKTECTIRSAYFRAYRRYAQWITKSEGVDTNKIDVKGLEFKKSNFPAEYGAFFKQLLKDVLEGYTQEELNKKVLAFREKIMDESFPMELLGSPTSVKTLNKYIEKKARAGELFSKIAKGAPAAVRATIYYNDLLKFWKLNTQANYISQGGKVKWVYLKGNPFRIDVLAYPEYGDIPPKIKDFLIKFTNRKKSFETILENKLDNFFKDLGWELNTNPYTNVWEKFGKL